MALSAEKKAFLLKVLEQPMHVFINRGMTMKQEKLIDRGLDKILDDQEGTLNAAEKEALRWLFKDSWPGEDTATKESLDIDLS